MKYSFKQQDLNNWKGRITESLTRFYIRDVLAPKLEQEGWDKVLFLQSIPLRIPARPLEELSTGKQGLYHDKYKDIKIRLLSEDIYPTQEFLEKCDKINSLLEHSPDGFLLKLKKTGEKKQMKV